jgi:type IV pilus assembly protein PilY1
MNIRNELRSVGLGLAVSFVLAVPALPAHADDTEIFVGRLGDEADPNVLFVIDTSGSMDTVVNFLAYDPDVTYAGDCAADRIYWDFDGDIPNCKTSDYWFNASALYCKAAMNALASKGEFRDDIGYWYDTSGTSNDRWRDMEPGVKTAKVECQDDDGKHGDGINTSKVYPARRGSGPWTSSATSSDRVNLGDLKKVTLYSSNYLNYWLAEQKREVTRMQVVKDVMHEVLGSTTDINIGLMRFSSDGDGGYMLYPMSPIEETRDEFLATVDQMEPLGNTPLSETLYEAGQYYAGRAVDFGLNARGNNGEYATSVASSRNGNTYISPIGTQCQKQFIVLLTDGDPVEDTGANSKIPALPGFKEATGQTSCSGNCLDEMAAYLQNHDLSASLDEDQVVDTYTIGFATDQTLLKATADRGNGKYYTAENAEELTDAFKKIIDDVVKKNVSFTAPTVSVNTFNRLTHRSELYFALFQPSNTAHWDGNLKRYKLADLDGVSTILDAEGRPAVDPVTDAFADGTRSFWTLGGPDGSDTTKGGFASRLGKNRKVWTITSGARKDVLLATDANAVHEDNSLLTAALLGAANDTERSELIRWARGIDANGEPLHILGDALHSKPLVVSYGGTQDNPDLALFYTTNDGYFHAVNPLAGDTEDLELFSFIPPEMLDRLKVLRKNDAVEDKVYGLDGPMTAYIAGDGGNGAVDSGETLYLYFGERRGGRDYYALDVTNRSAPRLAWMIEGGAGDFAELGQSWSAMSVGKVKLNGAVRHVLFFGGGYDTGQDAPGPSVDDNVGRAIYMIDAETGQRLWWAANAADHPDASLPLADMTHSIPSDLRVVDVNADGFTDRIYVGDMGAKIWRIDIDNEGNKGPSDFATGGVIADLGSAGAAGNRRFYYPPSVSWITDEHLGTFLTIAIGSGHRANPLGTPGKDNEDRFYMIRDTNVLGPALDSNGKAVYTVITEADLLDVTTETDPSTEDLAAHDGWMIRLNAKEKSLAGALSADNRIFFTTYTPDPEVTQTCNASGATGKALAYEVDILTGGPTVYDDPLDDEPPVGDPSCNYRCDETAGPIPPEPVLVFQENEKDDDDEDDEDDAGECDGIAKVSMIIGTDVSNPGICTAPVRTYWYAQQEE